MAWTETTRARYERHSGRYASDLTDQEWGLIAPFLPPPKTTGRPRSTAMRDVLDAILYIASAGCAWRMLPNDFPPVSTVRYYFYGWRNDGIFEVISHFLVATAREFHGKKPGPTAGVIDSQTIKTTESGGISGYDAGKKTKGRKRHIVTDTLGFMVGLVVHSAGIQDRDGAPEVLKSIRSSHPNLRHIFADGGYAGPKLRDALEGIGDWTIPDRQALRHCGRLRSHSQKMGRRAHLRMAQPLPAIGQRLGKIHRKFTGMDTRCTYQNPHA